MQKHPPRSHAIHSRVRSYSRAGGRLSESQAEALAALAPRYVAEVPRRDAVRTVAPGFRAERDVRLSEGMRRIQPRSWLITWFPLFRMIEEKILVLTTR